jgi:hypothetical protein
VQIAAEKGRDVILYDTAGRLAIDEPLMQELAEIDARVHPGNILLVVDAMIGQDAVGTAKAFNDRLNLDGVILTKLDGDARGGAALSVRAVTGKPIKFVGMGEASDRLEEFRPDGMASRILGKGDVVGLIQQFEDVVDEEKAEQDAKRMLTGKFDMNDFQEQLQVLKKMGPLKEMVEKIPGIADAIPEGAQVSDDELVRIGSMISSMTATNAVTRAVHHHQLGRGCGGRQAQEEAQRVLRVSRLGRVARGSGHREQEVADLLNRFAMMRQMMMQIGMQTGLLGKIPGFKQLAQAKKMMGLDVNQLANMMQTPSAERGHFQAPKRNVDRMKEKRQAQGRPQGAQEGAQAPLAAHRACGAERLIVARFAAEYQVGRDRDDGRQHEGGHERRDARAMVQWRLVGRCGSTRAERRVAMAGCISSIAWRCSGVGAAPAE